jgi:hypothetical protein
LRPRNPPDQPQDIKEFNMADTSIGAVLSSILQVVKDNSLAAALGPVNALLTSVQQNPDPVNLAAQAAAFQVNLLAAVPNLEQATVKDVAAIVQQQVNALAASLAAAKPAAAS